MLTADEAKQIWDYNPLTGVFIWKVKPRQRINIGDRAGQKDREGYWYLTYQGKRYRGSRMAWLIMTGSWPKEQMDHINTNTSDDRFENLREATIRQNAMNRRVRKNNSLGIKGIRKHRSKYRVSIKIDGKETHIGIFETADDAKAARDSAAQRIHGEFFRP